MPPSTSAQYLGLQLSSPVVIGACPMTLNPEAVRALSIAGAGAIVLPSLFEEQVVHQVTESGELTSRRRSRAESVADGQVEDRFNGGPQGYVDSIVSLKRTTGLPVIASLNGCTSGHWLGIASALEQAGADALEVSLEADPPDPTIGADRVEELLLKSVAALCDLVSIPVSVKLSPFHTNLPNLAWNLSESGASGLVCFAHDPTWQVQKDRIEASLNWSLSQTRSVNETISGVIRVCCGGPPISIAACGGIRSSEDVVKTIIAGADVVMVTSEIYRVGPDAIAHLTEGLSSYLERHNFTSFADLLQARPIPSPYRRSAYLRSLSRSNHDVDPKPNPLPRSGDRWGHVR